MSIDAFLTLDTVMRVLSLIMFIGIIWYAFTPARRHNLEQQGRLVLNELPPEGK